MQRKLYGSQSSDEVNNDKNKIQRLDRERGKSESSNEQEYSSRRSVNSTSNIETVEESIHLYEDGYRHHDGDSGLSSQGMLFGSPRGSLRGSSSSTRRSVESELESPSAVDIDLIEDDLHTYEEDDLIDRDIDESGEKGNGLSVEDMLYWEQSHLIVFKQNGRMHSSDDFLDLMTDDGDREGFSSRLSCLLNLIPPSVSSSNSGRLSTQIQDNIMESIKFAVEIVGAAVNRSMTVITSKNLDTEVEIALSVCRLVCENVPAIVKAGNSILGLLTSQSLPPYTCLSASDSFLWCKLLCGLIADLSVLSTTTCDMSTADRWCIVALLTDILKSRNKSKFDNSKRDSGADHNGGYVNGEKKISTIAFLPSDQQYLAVHLLCGAVKALSTFLPSSPSTLNIDPIYGLSSSPEVLTMLIAQQVPSTLTECLDFGPKDRLVNPINYHSFNSQDNSDSDGNHTADWRLLDAEVCLALSMIIKCSAFALEGDDMDSKNEGMPLMQMLNGKNKSRVGTAEGGFSSPGGVGGTGGLSPSDRQQRLIATIADKVASGKDNSSDLGDVGQRLSHMLHLLSLLCHSDSVINETPYQMNRNEDVRGAVTHVLAMISSPKGGKDSSIQLCHRMISYSRGIVLQSLEDILQLHSRTGGIYAYVYILYLHLIIYI